MALPVNEAQDDVLKRFFASAAKEGGFTLREVNCVPLAGSWRRQLVPEGGSGGKLAAVDAPVRILK